MLAEEGLTVIEEEERMMTDAGGQFCFAHNGWVMDADPMVNFAEPGQSCYSVVFLFDYQLCVLLYTALAI